MTGGPSVTKNEGVGVGQGAYIFYQLLLASVSEDAQALSPASAAKENQGQGDRRVRGRDRDDPGWLLQSWVLLTTTMAKAALCSRGDRYVSRQRKSRDGRIPLYHEEPHLRGSAEKTSSSSSLTALVRLRPDISLEKTHTASDT